MNIDIMYEDEHCLAVHKPEGLLVHNTTFSTEETLVDWFLEKYPQAQNVGEEQLSQKGIPLERSGVVHRLDTDTSGIIVLAKTQDAFVHLKQQFHDRLVKKEYRAFVYGPVREQWGSIDRPIGRSNKDFRLRSAQHGARGLLRPSLTLLECIGTGRFEGEHFSYMKLMPKTGRTHQLRVHLQAIGRPIVGDALYAKTEIAKSNNLGFTRLALHAHVLELTLFTGGLQRLIAPLPQSFEEAAERIAE